MTITEFEIPWVSGDRTVKQWEINSKEDFYREFPINVYGQVILGSSLHLIALASNGYYLPIGNIKSKEDYKLLESWGIPKLKDLIHDNN